jgi:DNA gyrase subunit B
LGTGIGKDDFDLARLRYHKLIIMCDADVDGSHIRTLILTFFFRQMNDLIRRGFLYIAQPPLYKVAEGKKETYLKDDREYRAFLVARIQDAWEVALDDGRAIKGARLAAWVEKVEQLRENLIKLMSRGYPADALRAALLGGLTDKKALSDPTKVEEVAHVLEAMGFHGVAVATDTEHGTGVLAFVSRRDGVERQVKLDWHLLTSVEYRALATNTAGLEAMAAKRFALKKAEEPAAEADAPAAMPAKRTRHARIEPVVVATLDEAMDTLYSGAKKGLAIQRYKGLGEMNAEQLWQTTMDPQKRRLLQVKIEDDVEADSIFTILMGDLVEPRREFIETNALNVRNLDV